MEEEGSDGDQTRAAVHTFTHRFSLPASEGGRRQGRARAHLSRGRQDWTNRPVVRGMGTLAIKMEVRCGRVGEKGTGRWATAVARARPVPRALAGFPQDWTRPLQPSPAVSPICLSGAISSHLDWPAVFGVSSQ